MMDDEKLISIVSGYPELYDIENEHYMNQTRKNNIWTEISTLMGVDDVICKEKWKSLRDAYHRSLKRRRKPKSGDAAKKIKKWRFENQMEFMRPYFQERSAKGNISNATLSDEDQVSDPDTVTSPFSVPVNSPRPSSRATSTPDIESAPSPSSSAPNSLKTTTSTVFKKMTARKKNTQQSQSQVANVLEKYLDSRKTSHSVEPTNSIHSFFKAMADTVVGLSPGLQLKVKNQVYSIVSQAEFENLRHTPTSSVSAECELFTPNVTLPRQEQPTTTVLKNDNKANEETQYVLQDGTQYIIQPSQSILQTPVKNIQSQPTLNIAQAHVNPQLSLSTAQVSVDNVQSQAPVQQQSQSPVEQQSQAPIQQQPPAPVQQQSQPRYRYYINPNGEIAYEDLNPTDHDYY